MDIMLTCINCGLIKPDYEFAKIDSWAGHLCYDCVENEGYNWFFGKR